MAINLHILSGRNLKSQRDDLWAATRQVHRKILDLVRTFLFPRLSLSSNIIATVC